jgi:hypothetical protein
MEQLIAQNVFDAIGVFDNSFVQSRALFLNYFQRVPSLTYVMDVEGRKALEVFKGKYAALIKSVYEHGYYTRRKEKEKIFIESVVVLRNACVLEFSKDYVDVLHDISDKDFVKEMIDFITQFKRRERRKPLEINLVMRQSGSLALKGMEIKRTGLNVDLFYEDDFKEVDEVIRKRLNRKNDKGIVLLHGLPGTGKTTYLRYLIGRIKKRVLFLSNNLAGNIIDPEFVELLVNNPNSVVIIEDAESIMMDRRSNAYSPVSNLLNISDGLLADFLNIQLICTFNSALGLVDPALMRKGRLIARYEFGKLSIDKAQRLSDHLGFDRRITKPMTLAEISNPNDKDETKIEVIGFRRHNEIMN